jgi:hypothetical protein
VWSCKACTFVNTGKKSRCDICDFNRRDEDVSKVAATQVFVKPPAPVIQATALEASTTSGGLAKMTKRKSLDSADAPSGYSYVKPTGGVKNRVYIPGNEFKLRTSTTAAAAPKVADQDNVSQGSKGSIIKAKSMPVPSAVVSKKKRAGDEDVSSLSSEKKKGKLSPPGDMDGVSAEKVTIICMSNFNNDDDRMKLVERCVSKLPGNYKLLSSRDASVPFTHLVLDGEVKTQKTLFAFARGVPIVDFKWIEASNTAKSWQDHNKYLTFETGAKSRLLNRGKILKGLEIFLDPSVTNPKPEVIKQLVTLAGGRIVTSVSSAELIILGHSKDQDWAGLGSQPPCVTLEWLYDSLTRGECQAFLSYLPVVAVETPLSPHY